MGAGLRGEPRVVAHRQDNALTSAEPPGNSLSRLIFLAAVAAGTMAATVAWLSLDRIRKRRIL
jgi:hypothetical protein